MIPKHVYPNSANLRSLVVHLERLLKDDVSKLNIIKLTTCKKIFLQTWMFLQLCKLSFCKSLQFLKQKGLRYFWIKLCWLYPYLARCIIASSWILIHPLAMKLFSLWHPFVRALTPLLLIISHHEMSMWVRKGHPLNQIDYQVGPLSLDNPEKILFLPEQVRWGTNLWLTDSYLDPVIEAYDNSEKDFCRCDLLFSCNAGGSGPQLNCSTVKKWLAPGHQQPDTREGLVFGGSPHTA